MGINGQNYDTGGTCMVAIREDRPRVPDVRVITGERRHFGAKLMAESVKRCRFQ